MHSSTRLLPGKIHAEPLNIPAKVAFRVPCCAPQFILASFLTPRFRCAFALRFLWARSGRFSFWLHPMRERSARSRRLQIANPLLKRPLPAHPQRQQQPSQSRSRRHKLLPLANPQLRRRNLRLRKPHLPSNHPPTNHHRPRPRLRLRISRPLPPNRHPHQRLPRLLRQELHPPSPRRSAKTRSRA